MMQQEQLNAEGIDRPKSQTEWRKEGRKIKVGEQPVRTIRGRHCSYGVYDMNQTEPVRSLAALPPVAAEITIENVLTAIFTVNRAAKRFRDAAQASYKAGAHGLAHVHRQKKEELYALKDHGLEYAIQQEWLVADRIHGGLCLWVGYGYSFHSTMAPMSDVANEESGPIKQEAKPRGKKEPRLKDAMATLESLPDVMLSLRKLELPHFERPSCVTKCFHCGEVGHIARDCPDNDENEETEW